MTRSRTNRNVCEALLTLEKWGLLLLQDPKLPSLVGLIAGASVRGSWWGHPKGHAIFLAARELEDHPNVAITKLISAKITFTHRRLLPQVISIGRAREDWQMKGLSHDALALLNRVDEEEKVRSSGNAVKELETRLLVASEQVHTESGAHATEMMTWEAFARQAKVRVPRISAVQARTALEAVVDELNASFGAKGTLPWSRQRTR